MSKKVLIGLAIFILILTGTAVASVNGYFSGYPIVNVKVNGVNVEGDTPAIAFNGRTMVPVRFVSEAMGATVTWDAATETAIVTTTGASTASNDINRVKLYSRIANNYKNLSLMGDMLSDVSDSLSLAFNGFNMFNQSNAFDQAVANFNDDIGLYNKMLTINNNLIVEANNAGLDISDTQTILSKYGDAIEKYKLAFSSLDKYSSTRTDSSFNNYMSYRSTGDNSVYSGRAMADNGYDKFYNMVLNY